MHVKAGWLLQEAYELMFMRLGVLHGYVSSMKCPQNAFRSALDGL